MIPAALSWCKWQITCTHATRSGRSSPCKLHCMSAGQAPFSRRRVRVAVPAIWPLARSPGRIKSYYSSALLLLLAMDACLIWGDGRKVRLERNGAVAAVGSCLVRARAGVHVHAWGISSEDCLHVLVRGAAWAADSYRAR